LGFLGMEEEWEFRRKDGLEEIHFFFVQLKSSTDELFVTF